MPSHGPTFDEGAFSSFRSMFTLDNILRFPTQKYIVIKDRTLGLLYVALQMGVLVYVLALILSSKSYLARSEPGIVISVWSSPVSFAAGTTQSESTPPFCSCHQNPSHSNCTRYNSVLPSFSAVDTFACSELPHSQSVKVDTEQVFVTTAVQETTTLGHAHSRDFDMPCPAEIAGHPLTALQGQTCLYSRSSNWINVAADNTILGIQHSPEGKAGMALSCSVRSASAPRTDIAVASESMNATLTQWLTWAGVDLDTPLDLLPPGALVQAAPTTDSAAMPMLRTWGLELTVRVKYYNYGLISSARISSDLHCVIEVEPRVRMTQQELSYTMTPGAFPTNTTPLTAFAVRDGAAPAADGTDSSGGDAGSQAAVVDFTANNVNALGVRMKVSTGGTIGHISIVNVVTTLTTGLVLSQAVGVFVQGVAMFLRGAKSLCYFTVIREEIDVKRIFARYALRCVCAVLLYSLLDDDKSATIDTTEMFCVLREMFSDFMDDSQVVALTDYLMTTVGQQQGTKHVNFMEQELSRFAFIELFTEDDMNITTMRKLMKNVFRRDKEQYKQLQVQLAGNARELGQSKFLSEISQRKMSEASFTTGGADPGGSVMHSLLSRPSTAARLHQSFASRTSNDSRWRARQRQPASGAAAAAAVATDDVMLPVPGAAVLFRGGPHEAAAGESQLSLAPSLLNSQTNSWAEPQGPDALGLQSLIRSVGSSQSQYPSARIDSLASDVGPLSRSLGSIGMDPMGDGARSRLRPDAGRPAAARPRVLGALWSTAQHNLSGRPVVAAAVPEQSSSEVSADSGADGLGGGDPGGLDARLLGTALHGTGAAVRAEPAAAQVFSLSRLYMSGVSSPTHSAPSAQQESPHSPQQTSPRSAAVGRGRGFQGPVRAVTPLGLADILWQDLVRSGSAPPAYRVAQDAAPQATAAASALAGSDDSSMVEVGDEDMPHVHVVSHAVDFRTGTLRRAVDGERGGGGHTAQQTQRSVTMAGRGGSAGRALGEGVRRRSSSFGITMDGGVGGAVVEQADKHARAGGPADGEALRRGGSQRDCRARRWWRRVKRPLGTEDATQVE
eukprot:jgi/Ulvmu1/12086/UM084_0009.1